MDMPYPPERDFGFYQRRKHDKWRAVEVPALDAPVADTHAHLHMLPDPAWELARCAVNGVDFVCEVADPGEGEGTIVSQVAAWRDRAAEILTDSGETAAVPRVCVAVGVHPHGARRYDDAVESRLVRLLADPAVRAVGEIGLDFHYDLSPRDVQRRVFRRQLEIAADAGLPVALHLRGGEDPDRDNAHAEALRILEEVGFPQAGTLLHCCSLPADELRPWVEAGCYIAYGGALTFKRSDAARDAVRLVPPDRLLLETDAPYMAPEPMRGVACTPAHVVFTAALLRDLSGVPLSQVHANAERFFG